jgi:hypothetical protein
MVGVALVFLFLTLVLSVLSGWVAYVVVLAVGLSSRCLLLRLRRRRPLNQGTDF